MPYKDKDKQREYQRKYQREWARKNRQSQRNYCRNLRQQVLELLGNKCINCGCDIVEALEINHKKGGGNQEKKNKYKKSAKWFYLDILKNRRNTQDLELRCIICNSHHRLTQLQKIPDFWKIVWNKPKDLLTNNN